MSEPSSPVNGQNRVVEGLVTTAGAAGYRKGTNAEAVAGSSYNALDQVVTLGTTPIVGALTETAPGTDTASSGLNGRLQRIAQRLTSLIALLPTSLGGNGGLTVEGPTAGAGWPLAQVGGDAQSATDIALMSTNNSTAYGLETHPYQFNGSTWDRQRNNVDASLLASAARTATTSSADQTNYNGRGALITIDVTSITATPSLVVTVEAKDALSGKYVTLLTSAAITSVSTVQLAVYPGVTAAANLAVSMILPRTWRVTVTAADADSATYSVGASNIP